jgi:hypothetical protein
LRVAEGAVSAAFGFVPTGSLTRNGTRAPSVVSARRFGTAFLVTLWGGTPWRVGERGSPLHPDLSPPGTPGRDTFASCGEGSPLTRESDQKWNASPSVVNARCGSGRSFRSLAPQRDAKFGAAFLVTLRVGTLLRVAERGSPLDSDLSPQVGTLLRVVERGRGDWRMVLRRASPPEAAS